MPDGTCASDYSAIIEQFNSICTALPKVKTISKQRKKAILSAIELLNGADITELFKKTAASDWLSGKNPNGWTANFDWILEPKHLVGIMEGNYDNRNSHSSAPETTDYTCGGKYINALTATDDDGFLF